MWDIFGISDFCDILRCVSKTNETRTKYKLKKTRMCPNQIKRE